MGMIHDMYKAARAKKDMQPFLEYLSTITDPLVINEEDESQQTVLCYAVAEADVAVAQALLSKRAKTTSSAPQSPLFLATFSDNPEALIPVLVAHGASIDETDMNGFSLLYWPAVKNDLRRMRVLLDNDVNVLHEDNGSSTVLMQAMGIEGISPPHAEKVKLLFAYGAGMTANFNQMPTPSPELLDGAVLIGATKGGSKITRATPEFRKAIFTVEEFIQATKDEYSFNYLALHNTVMRLISAGSQDAELIKFEAYLKPLALQAKEITSSRGVANAAFYQPGRVAAAGRASEHLSLSGAAHVHTNGKPAVK